MDEHMPRIRDAERTHPAVRCEKVDQIGARIVDVLGHQIGVGATHEGGVRGANGRQTVGLGNNDLASRTHRLRQSADISTGKCDEAINIAGIELRRSAALQSLRKCASDADVLIDRHKIAPERGIMMLQMTGREERHGGAISGTTRSSAIWTFPEPGRETGSGREGSHDRVRDPTNTGNQPVGDRNRPAPVPDLSGARHELRNLYRVLAQPRTLRTPDGTETTVEAGAHHMILLGRGERRCNSEPGTRTIEEFEQSGEYVAATHAGPALTADRRRTCDFSTKIELVEVLGMKGVGYRCHD